MIKKYKSVTNRYFKKEEHLYFVGETDEIKAVYNSMLRAYGKEVSNLCPMFCDRPRFSAWKSVHAICVNVTTGYFQVVSSDTIMLLIVQGDIKEA